MHDAGDVDTRAGAAAQRSVSKGVTASRHSARSCGSLISQGSDCVQPQPRHLTRVLSRGGPIRAVSQLSVWNERTIFQVITTRSYDERLDTISAVRDAGISVCSGGILGLGESDKDRVGLIWEVSK